MIQINYGVNRRKPNGKKFQREHKNGKIFINISMKEWENNFGSSNKKIRAKIMEENEDWLITGYVCIGEVNETSL